MTCKCHPDSPFLWASRKERSIFAKDIQFAPKGATGKTGSQLATDAVEDKRREGKSPGTIYNLGSIAKQKELQLTAYKQFGIYSRAHPNVKPTPNKHEL
jgi:hypothetical protein